MYSGKRKWRFKLWLCKPNFTILTCNYSWISNLPCRLSKPNTLKSPLAQMPPPPISLSNSRLSAPLRGSRDWPRALRAWWTDLMRATTELGVGGLGYGMKREGWKPRGPHRARHLLCGRPSPSFRQSWLQTLILTYFCEFHQIFNFGSNYMYVPVIILHNPHVYKVDPSNLFLCQQLILENTTKKYFWLFE